MRSCAWVMLVALAACGRDPDAVSDAPEPDATDVDAEPIADASPIDAEIIDAPPAVCEPRPPPPPLPLARVSSGTRLIPRTIAEPVPGGVDVAWSIRDAALGVDCDPRPYHDGTIRCVPRAQDLHLLQGRRFADAARTIPIALEPLAAAPPAGTLAAVYTGGAQSPFGCMGGRLWPFGRIGALRGDTLYYEELGAPQPVPDGFGVYDLDVLADDFVELIEVRSQLSGPIAARELRGTDGSRLFATDLWDTDHDVEVGFMLVGGTWRLVPPRQSWVYGAHRAPPPGGVVDEAWCRARDGIFPAPAPDVACPAPPPRFVTDEWNQTHEVVLQTATLYSCEDPPGVLDAAGAQVLTYQTRQYLASCAHVPLTEWAEASYAPEGSGRLTTPVYSVGGQDVEWTSFRLFTDADLDVDCEPRPTADGSLRCLPVRHGAVAFADAACTSRIVFSSIGPVAYALEGSIPSNLFPSVRGTITVHGVGAARPAGTIYVRTPSSCARIDGVPSFELGAELPPSTFAAMELRDAP